MKKFRGTKFTRIGSSYSPLLDAEIARVEAMVFNQEARLNELLLQAHKLFGD